MTVGSIAEDLNFDRAWDNRPVVSNVSVNLPLDISQKFSFSVCVAWCVCARVCVRRS